MLPLLGEKRWERWNFFGEKLFIQYGFILVYRNVGGNSTFQ